MQIEEVGIYRIGHHEFPSEAKARDWLYDQIGELMDNNLSKIGLGALGPRERLGIVEALMLSSNKFSELLLAYEAEIIYDD